MIIIPAIDIKNGECVRLKQGKENLKTVYSKDPVKVAEKWVEEGAERLHIVDLDGAFSGRPVNLDIIKKIRQQINIPIELGGGIRSGDNIKKVFDSGIDFAVLGTAIFKDPGLIKELTDKELKKTIASIDATNGEVMINGWVKGSGIKLNDALAKIKDMGFKELVFTDTDRDGMLSGPNLDSLKEVLNSTDLSVIASGGISKIEDIKSLITLKYGNLKGCVIGKALYENTLSLKNAIETAS